MKDLGELVDKFCDQNNIYRFEGESGLENLEKLIKAIGYESCYFRYGTLLEVFYATIQEP